MMAPGKLLLLFIFAVTVQASSSITEDFSTTTNRDSANTTLVWNQALGQLHHTLSVQNWDEDGVGVSPDVNFSIGDGSDCAFNSSTYANFSIGGDVSGNIIRFDTTAHPELKVTSFQLDATWTLLPVGDNPLVIRSLSDVIV